MTLREPYCTIEENTREHLSSLKVLSFWYIQQRIEEHFKGLPIHRPTSICSTLLVLVGFLAMMISSWTRGLGF